MKRIFTLTLLIVISLTNVWGQISELHIDIEQPVWEKVTGGTEGPNLSRFAEANGRMWAIDDNNILVFSDDGGQNWEKRFTTNLSYMQQVFAGEFGVVYTLLRSEGHYVNYTDYLDFFYSEDNGASFTKSETTIIASSHSNHGGTTSQGFFQKSPTELIEISHYNGYGGPSYSVKSSFDSGRTFDIFQIYSNSYFDVMSDMVYDVHSDTLSSLIQRQDSVWVLNTFTDDYDNPAVDTFNLPEQISVKSFHHYNGQLILLSSDNRLFLSENLGQTWSIYFDDPTSPLEGNIQYGTDQIYAKSGSRLYTISYDDLDNKTLIFEDTTGYLITYAESSAGILTSTPEGVYLREPSQVSFNLISSGVPGAIKDFKVAGSVLWVKEKIWHRSDDNGMNWFPTLIEILDNSRILTEFNNVFLLEKDNQIYRSTDNGHTWESAISFQGLVKVAKHQDGIVLYDHFQIYFSEDGINFTEVTRPATGGNFVWYEDRLLYLNDGQRYESDNNGLNWDVPEPTQGTNNGLIENGDQLVNIQNISDLAFIRHSNDGGYSWIEHKALYPILFPYFDVSPIYIGQYDEIRFFIHLSGTSITADNGQTWAYIQTPFRYKYNAYGHSEWMRAPKKLAHISDVLYGIGDLNGLQRTSLPFLKNQLPDSTIIKDQITGHLYKDLNDNCINDPSDLPIPNKVIQVGEQHRRTDDNGWYGLFYDFNNSEVSFQTDSIRHHEHNCEYTNEGILLLDENADTDTLDIAFHPIPDIIDGGITAWTTGVFRPGGVPQIRIKITNYGAVPLVDENLILTYNPALQTITTNSDGMALGDNQWVIPYNLEPGTDETFIIRLDISTAATNSDILNYQLALPLTDDVNLSDNEVSFFRNIVTSIDPNDKTAYEETTLPYTQNEFIYRIRFQNTGNDTAFKVVILDTLPPQLDILTLEMLDASHPYELRIHDPVLRWTFSNILLPDSTTNEPDSHGYLFFKIKTKNDLAITDTIRNSAAIYFDYNDPVITEQAVTEIEKGYRETNHFLTVCSGDEINETAVFMDTTITNIDTTDLIYDVVTNSIIEVVSTYYLDSLIALFPGDTILGVPVFSDTSFIYQIAANEGCDTIINFQIDLLTSTDDLDNHSFTAQVQPNPTAGATRLILNTTENRQVDISLYNLTGQQVKTIFSDKNLFAGRHDIPINLEQLPPGVYYLKIATDQRKEILRVLKID